MQLPEGRLSEARKSEPRLRFLGFASGANRQYFWSSLTSFRFVAFGVVGGESCSSEVPLAADLRPAFLKRMPQALQRDCKCSR